MSKHLFILDRAHGSNVKGKRSPDGKHLEYLYSQKTIDALKIRFKAKGYAYAETVIGMTEIGLLTRLKRINALADKAYHGGLQPLMISFHNNAAAKTGWSKATGVEVFTSVGQTRSDKYADILMGFFEKRFKEVIMRRDLSDGDSDKEVNFTVLMGRPPSVLVEFLFQDSIKDLPLLQSEEIFNRYIDCLMEFFDYVELHDIQTL